MLWPLPLFCVIGTRTLSSCLFCNRRTEVIAFYSVYFLKIFSLSLFYLFSVSSAKFNSLVIKEGLEQRILNEAAIFFPLWDYFLFSSSQFMSRSLRGMVDQWRIFLRVWILEQNAVNNSPQPKLVGGRLSLVKHTRHCLSSVKAQTWTNLLNRLA